MWHKVLQAGQHAALAHPSCSARNLMREARPTAPYMQPRQGQPEAGAWCKGSHASGCPHPFANTTMHMALGCLPVFCWTCVRLCSF